MEKQAYEELVLDKTDIQYALIKVYTEEGKEVEKVEINIIINDENEPQTVIAKIKRRIK